MSQSTRSPAPTPPQPWSLSRVVDFEYTIQKDSKQDEATLLKRDQSIARSLAQTNKATSESKSNSTLLSFWLSALSSQHEDANIGQHVLRSATTASRVLYFIYGLVGLMLGFQLLSYNGTQPVNVSAFFGLVILLQFAFTLLSVFLVLIAYPRSTPLELSPGIRLSRFLLGVASSVVMRLNTHSVSKQSRQRLLALLAHLQGRLGLYRNPVRWLSCSVACKCGIVFNIGISIATIAAVIFSDRAFGWQTSLDISPEFIHQLVSTLALPWSWFLGEGAGYPSLSQITGSQIILKDGIQSLETPHLTAWWPFLLLSTLVYGLLPRLLILAVSNKALKSCIHNLDFNDSASRRILHRLNLPESPFATIRSENKPSEPSKSISNAVLSPSKPAGSTPEIWASPSLSQNPALAAYIKQHHGSATICELSHSQLGNPDKLFGTSSTPERPLLFVFEAWLPPLEETKQLLRKSRDARNTNTPIDILLITDSPSTPSNDTLVWKTAISQLGDPYLHLEIIELPQPPPDPPIPEA